MTFKYELREVVQLVESSEFGTIIGRAEYTGDENSYLIRYKAGDGRQVQAWWAETAIETYKSSTDITFTQAGVA